MPIRKVTRFMRRNPRLALGLQVAMTVLAHNKAAAVKPPARAALLASIPQGLPKAIKDKTERALQEGHDIEEAASAVWEAAQEVAEDEMPETHTGESARPMNYEQARLWLQAYNAGPYALLKYKGTVPYKETRNYVPRVMKYYQQDLSNTPYDKLIVETAHKYGLDPQMVRAVMKTESSFNPKTVSHAGARGLMQVMPVVWKDISKRYGPRWGEYSSNVFDPAKNIEVACAYLAWLRFDFLPRHFGAFEKEEPAPPALVRDKAPPRKTARLVTEVAQAAEDEHKAAVTRSPRVQKKGARDMAQATGIRIEESRAKKPSSEGARAVR